RLVVLRGAQPALVAASAEPHRQVDGAAREDGEEQDLGDQAARPPASCTGGATLSTSSIVVRPAPTFIAPLMRSAFMPSLKACSRMRAISAPAFTSDFISLENSSTS